MAGKRAVHSAQRQEGLTVSRKARTQREEVIKKSESLLEQLRQLITDMMSNVTSKDQEISAKKAVKGKDYKQF